MTSACSVISQEANYLVDGVNSMYLKGSDLYVFDGIHERKISEGKSAFDVWVEHQESREDPYTYDEFIQAITGSSGSDGAPGIDGKSAFDVWCEQQPVRYGEEEEEIPYTVEEFIEAITGKDGKSAFDVWCEQQETREEPYTYADYIEAITGPSGSNGTNGIDGKSAFDVWCEQQETRDEPYTYAEYIEAITGPSGSNGTNGTNGKSAFEVWSEQQPVRYEQDGCTVKPYTYAEFIEAITGPPGINGTNGTNGKDGKDADSNTWLDWLNTALNTGDIAGIVALQNEISTLQTALAAVQGQLAGILGTTSVSGPANNIMDVADDLSEFSDVAQEGRSMVDSLSDWFNSFRSRIAGQTNRYNQLTNDFTSPALQSVSNESALADVSLLGDGLVL